MKMKQVSIKGAWFVVFPDCQPEHRSQRGYLPTSITNRDDAEIYRDTHFPTSRLYHEITEIHGEEVEEE